MANLYLVLAKQNEAPEQLANLIDPLIMAPTSKTYHGRPTPNRPICNHLRALYLQKTQKP